MPKLLIPSIIFFLSWWMPQIQAFSAGRSIHGQRRPLLRLYDAPVTEEKSEAADAVWKLNASGSFGNLLMQMQRKELDTNETTYLDVTTAQKEKEQSSKHNITLERGENKDERKEASTPEPAPFVLLEDLTTMDLVTAKELDESVTKLPDTGLDSWTEGMVEMPLEDMYLLQQKQPLPTMTSLEWDDDAFQEMPLLSRPTHYRDRIGRDLRHLAVSVAASVDTVEEWQRASPVLGGVRPLLLTIREGAGAAADTLRSSRSLRNLPRPTQQQQQQEDWSLRNGLPVSSLHQQSGKDFNEAEYFLEASCRACRAVRDLCALSPEVAAATTDSILRANHAWNGTLMEDFRTLLLYHAATTKKDEREQRRGFRLRRSLKSVVGLRSQPWRRRRRMHRSKRETRRRSQLYVTQLLLAMTVASDDAVQAIRDTDGLPEAIIACSSYAGKQRRRRWLRYPGELVKWFWRSSQTTSKQQQRKLRLPFMEADSVSNNLDGQIQRSANQILAAIGYNRWIPKIPGQRGLRILCLDGGGSRGMVAVTAVRCLMETAGHGSEVSDSFDMIAGTSTGGIIAFLVGLRQETSAKAAERYSQLIKQIFVKSALSTPLMLFTTATYDESPFMDILSNILNDESMLDSRADPAVPLVFAVTSKMSSTPTHVALFRNYNYGGGELPDPFTVDPDTAREKLGLPLELEHQELRSSSSYRDKRFVRVDDSIGSRHPGSFRVLQRYALRASTAAPTVFKPVMMGGEMYCDGGIVASNPAAVAIHEARTLFPDVPIEMVVSIGTGAFVEQKSQPGIGWASIIGQIVNSATDGEQIHHLLEDVLGDASVLGKRLSVSKTRYYRFNPVIGLPDEFPIDVTDPEKLEKLRQITRDYMSQPEQLKKIDEIADLLKGNNRWTWWK